MEVRAKRLRKAKALETELFDYHVLHKLLPELSCIRYRFDCCPNEVRCHQRAQANPSPGGEAGGSLKWRLTGF